MFSLSSGSSLISFRWKCLHTHLLDLIRLGGVQLCIPLCYVNVLLVFEYFVSDVIETLFPFKQYLCNIVL